MAFDINTKAYSLRGSNLTGSVANNHRVEEMRYGVACAMRTLPCMFQSHVV